MSEIKFSKYGGIYYTDEIDFETDIEVSTIVFTDDEDLIGTTIEQVSARHVKGDIVAIRGAK